ncbi:ABC transporter ATP-binding protein [Candidatus Nitrospira nitrificans]|uniref:Sugar ABC transporter ATP-binding protein n=1 Tax=Candidatus Nitrospira nitrificans TaxID=1742973 RepID=A0A0S4LHM0_9BACT|nr:ABC transporter ATP-binding protein [Candidatus Nitrospira nitrificans]CUS36088.1 Sugar ABC transporter ATP-binding protein [Candidatus Nitrospira nitrificans]
MSAPITPPIRLDAISKCYRIFRNPQDRFKQALLDRFQGVLGKRNMSSLYREHWALRDVSFEVQRGEAVGILGRNGAGKSTLLQIIAGTVAPTSGTVQTTGRITALLELGSGFNPEFTGRENVVLNAQILGLSREDALARFDDIASFADIGDFIDQPVKTYSSGMMMRLAFAVQTVMEPDVVIVDEALSVGDAKFQEKCFRKLRMLREMGTTILFVSHDINAVTSFCDQAFLFDAGQIVDAGKPVSVSKAYIENLYSEPAKRSIHEKRKDSEVEAEPGTTLLSQGTAHHTSKTNAAQDGYRFGDRKVEILSVAIFDQAGKKTEVLVSGNQYRITQTVVAHFPVVDLSSGFIIRNTKGVDIFGVTNKTAAVEIPRIEAGQIFEVSIEIDAWLAAGDYFLQAANAGADGAQCDCRIDALHFVVINTPTLFTTSIVNLNPKLRFGVMKNDQRMMGSLGG